MTLFIDDRESKKLFKAFDDAKIDYIVKRLEIGDIFEDEKNILIEHKAVGDYVASLHDGRLFNQVYKMNEVAEQSYLLIEGDFKSLYFEAKKSGRDLHFSVNQKIGSMVSILVRSNTKILQLDNLNQYVNAVIKIIEKSSDGKQLKTYNKVQKGVNLKQILMLVPGISDAKAETIRKTYPTLKILIESLKSEDFHVKGIGEKLKSNLKELEKI